MREAVVVAAARTPVGRGRADGALAAWHPVDLLAEVLRGLVDRAGLDPGTIDDVIAGCVSQAGEQAVNIARNAVLAAGFPERIPATTVDRQCGSSQQAAHFAAQGVLAGAYDVVVACGIEMMSRVPMMSATMGRDPFGESVARRYAPGLVGQGISAELIAARWGFERDDLDRYALRSHRLAADATDAGLFAREILPVKITRPDGQVDELRSDEGIRRDTTLQRLSQLDPAFYDPETAERFPEIRWLVTAGSSSQISDGAAAVLIMERRRAEALGLRPSARFTSFAVTGDDPLIMLTGIIPASHQALERAGLGVGEIDVFEINEAFAPVVLAWLRDTGADPDRVNVHGGAIALGHPLGASGTRLMVTLVHALEQRDGRYGLQAMCEGGGMANATVLERLT